MTMTDAPNFGTKFGRRKPCLRYIGPLLCTASVASVALTPPSWTHRPAPPPVGGGLRPAPLARSVSAPIPVAPERLPPRVGADLCVRPWAGPARDRVRADTSVGPYISHDPGKPGGDGAPPLHDTQRRVRPPPCGKGKYAPRAAIWPPLALFGRSLNGRRRGRSPAVLTGEENRFTPWYSYRSSPGSARWGCPCRRSRRSGRRGNR